MALRSGYIASARTSGSQVLAYLRVEFTHDVT